MIKNFRDLKVWQHAMELVQTVYKESRKFPKEETYCLTVQIRRAVISVPSNIAEGHGRKGPREYRRFCSIAHGSLMEVLTQALIAKDLGYWDEKVTESIVERVETVSKLLRNLISKLH